MCGPSGQQRPVTTGPNTGASDLQTYQGRRVVWAFAAAGNTAAVGLGQGASIAPGFNGPICMPVPSALTGVAADTVTLVIDLGGNDGMR